MLKQSLTRVLSLLLVMTMFLGLAPMYAWADTETGTDTGVEIGAEIVTDGEEPPVTEPEINEDDYGFVRSYEQFLTLFKQLEFYAQEYAALNNKDAGMLVLNFVRCGVERYLDDNWQTLGGAHEEGFTNFVIAKDADAANTTKVMPLRNLMNFTLPNGNSADFGHMFGCMNISYVNKGGADISGWAGDLCDLLKYSAEYGNVPDGTIDQMAAFIKDYCFGVDASKAFGWNDFYGDMDAFYLVNEYKKNNGSVLFSTLMEEYYKNGVAFENEDIQAKNPDGLSDFDRTVYFINNRFGVADDGTGAAVRKAVYDAYSNNVSIALLEISYGVTTYNKLREACCYAFADYIYSQAKGCLIEGIIGDATAENGYYTVFSEEHSILAPGIEQDIKYAQTVDGKQIVYYIATVDVTKSDVDLMVNYNNNLPPVGKNIATQRVQDQAEALVYNYRNKVDENGNKLYENFNAIVATNGAGYNITNGTPSGLVVMEGVEYYPVTAPGFFGILKDGTAVIGTKEDYINNVNDIQNTIREGIAAFGSVLVKDGKVAVTKSPNYTSNRASRTAIGITKEGKVIMMVLDGRQLPFSAGGSMEEIAQIMLEAGCWQAVNLDGGGSTTYLSKPAGSDELQLVNRPSDGFARSVATSLVAVSTAKPSTEFDRAIVSSDYEYITVGTSMQFSVTGVSNTGNSAPIPAGSYWRVSDESIATIDPTGVFTALENGTVTVEYVVNGEVKGAKEIGVVVPDDISFAEESMTAIFGEPKEILLNLWYNSKPVAFTPMQDTAVLFMDTEDLVSSAGVIDGMNIIGDAEAGIRSVTIMGVLPLAEDVALEFATVNFYYADEATFDFDNADMGNRSLAWNRTVTNARTLDNQVYYVTDKDDPVVIDYTFALDMSSIDIPPRFEELKSVLPGGDNPNATAWSFMLQLAERVCIQTHVKITAQFSQDVNVDISELKVVTDYFELTDYSVDENNVLTIVCNWINQTQPIDASTANPLCILTGIKLTVKKTAGYYNNRLVITNNGDVSYDIYLAATTLYTFPNEPGNEKYGLIPYKHEPPCRDAVNEDGSTINKDLGAHFASQYLDFADTYIINTESRNGWIEEMGKMYYYVDNLPVTGVQLLADRTDNTQKRFYMFDATGVLLGEQPVNGLIENAGNLYYATNGVVQTGWQTPDGTDYYYFDRDTGAAYNGVHTIREKMNPAVADGKTPMVDYTYTFEDYKLVLGDWVYDTNIYGNTGWRYRWAGDWKDYWFEVEGKKYFASKNYPNMVSTGYVRIMKQDATSSDDTQYHLFDDRGVLQEQYTGVYYDGTHYSYLQNGVRQITKGVYESNGYYYYVKGDGWIDVDLTSLYINSGLSHGFIPAGTYSIDAYGRIWIQQVDEGKIDKPSESSAGVTAKVLGRAVNVNASVACKVGYWDAATQKYITVEANANTHNEGGYDFVVPKEAQVAIVIAGDANNDGKADKDDYMAIANMILAAMMPKSRAAADAKAELAADLNGNGTVNAADLILLARSLRSGVSLEW